MHLCAVIQQWELQGIARYEYASLSWTGLQGETDYCFCPWGATETGRPRPLNAIVLVYTDIMNGDGVLCYIERIRWIRNLADPWPTMHVEFWCVSALNKHFLFTFYYKNPFWSSLLRISSQLSLTHLSLQMQQQMFLADNNLWLLNLLISKQQNSRSYEITVYKVEQFRS